MSQLRNVIRAAPFAAAVLVLLATSAHAGQVKVYDGIGSTNGGEFNMEVIEAFHGYSVGDVFPTYCVERNETIKVGGVYDVVVAGGAVNGGVGGGNPDPVDPMTAYLYQQYRRGQLRDDAGNLWGSGSSTQDVKDADDLQKAIWYIEQELYADSWVSTGDLSDFDADYNRYTRVAWDAVHVDETWSGVGNVRVLQLWNSDGENAQDQLVLVPIPSAVLAGLGLLACLLGYTWISRARTRRRTF